MKFSQAHIPTLRESPQEAEVISHQLMLRAGLIRRLASGIYSYLPLGWRVLRKIEQIIREEMNRAGAQEVSLPIVQPKEIWEESGRWQKYGKELGRFKDRHENEFCLQPTSEEAIVDLVKKDLNSYRQLPFNLYQIQTKFRDEIRPRFGIMRGREFIMKDAYSFDADEKSARESYQKMRAAYRRIFTRTGLEFRAVDADTGAIGGNDSEEFMVLASSGEDEIISCGSCSYAANQEKAASVFKHPPASRAVPSIEEFATPGLKTIEGLALQLKMKASELMKTLVATNAASEKFIILLRGDHELNLVKLGSALSQLKKSEGARLARDEELEAWNLPKGSLGPYGLSQPEFRVLMDDALDPDVAYISGANKEGFHIRNLVLNRDRKPDWMGCLRNIKEGEACPKCGESLQSSRGIEVGHVFYLGQKYSQSMSLKVRMESGDESFVEMGCYGIGVGRTMAACIEQNFDSSGIKWPLALAPYQIGILSLDEGEPFERAQKLYQTLLEQGYEVLWDDRQASAGVKLKDMDLIGIPYQIVFGNRALKESKCEIKKRSNTEKMLVPIDQAESTIKELVGKEVQNLNEALEALN